jgi:hypothetical protein
VRSHETDWTSLIAGLTFVAVGVSFLLGNVTGAHVDVRWVVALMLIGLGAAGLAGSFLHALSDRGTRPPAP